MVGMTRTISETSISDKGSIGTRGVWNDDAIKSGTPQCEIQEDLVMNIDQCASSMFLTICFICQRSFDCPREFQKFLSQKMSAIVNGLLDGGLKSECDRWTLLLILRVFLVGLTVDLAASESQSPTPSWIRLSNPWSVVAVLPGNQRAPVFP